MRIKKRKKNYNPVTPGANPPWKPGQSGNPRGRPVGSGSFKSLIRHMLNGKPVPVAGSAEFKTLKEQLATVALKRAAKGGFAFWNKIIDLHELRSVNEDDLTEFIDTVFGIVQQHVQKLEGGREALAAIARDLKHKEL